MRKGALPPVGNQTHKVCFLKSFRYQELYNRLPQSQTVHSFHLLYSEGPFKPLLSFIMILTSVLSFGALLTVASTAPVQARDSHLAPRAYKDVAQVLDRITLTVTKIATDVTAWPGNPRRSETLAQINGYVPIIMQDSANLISDLSVGTDWIQRNKQTTLGVVDAVSLIPRLASLNNAVSTYTTSLMEKRAWADSSSATPDIYDQLLLQKQWATALSTAITQSLGVTTSWLGGPISDFFFGSKLDEAIKGYGDGAKYRPGTAPGQAPPPQQGGPQWSAPRGQSASDVSQPGSQIWGSGAQQGQVPQYQQQGQEGWSHNSPPTGPGVQEAPQPTFEANPSVQDDKMAQPPADTNVVAPSVSP